MLAAALHCTLLLGSSHRASYPYIVYCDYTNDHTLFRCHLLHPPLVVQGLQCFQAKIGLSNTASLKLFKRLGYLEVSRSSIFNEVTMRLEVAGNVKEALEQQAESLHLTTYVDS